VNWEQIEQARHVLADRARRDITQAEFAMVLGVSIQGMNGWRCTRGGGAPRRPIRAPQLTTLYTLLMMPPETLEMMVEQLLAAPDRDARAALVDEALHLDPYDGMPPGTTLVQIGEATAIRLISETDPDAAVYTDGYTGPERRRSIS